MEMIKTPELVKRMAEKEGISKKEAKEKFNSVLEIIKEGIADENYGGVDVFGFAKFEVKEVEARERRNPSTGETFVKEAHNALKVKPSSVLKNLVK